MTVLGSSAGSIVRTEWTPDGHLRQRVLLGYGATKGHGKSLEKLVEETRGRFSSGFTQKDVRRFTIRA